MKVVENDEVFKREKNDSKIGMLENMFGNSKTLVNESKS